MTKSPPLLVPIAVDVMIHNGPATFKRGIMKYGQLAKLMPAEPAPFQDDEGDAFSTDPRFHGAYVMWTLPEALRRGAAPKTGGSHAFPLVPERWLVIRHHYPDPAGGGSRAAAPAVAAWVVQSDFLDKTAGTSPYLDPHAAEPTVTAIGRRVQISAATPWADPGPTTTPFLKAVAESCPAFAGYQPFNQDVFSIFDDLSTQGLAAGSVSYFVCGWYAAIGSDYVAQAKTPDDFATLLKESGWQASAAASVPTASCYHGAANGIRWDPAGPPPAKPTDDVQPQIAIGSTSIDGVVAFAHAAVAADPPSGGPDADHAAELVEAFQYDVLDRLALPGAGLIVEQDIRNRWFGSIDGGVAWALVGAPAAPGAAAKPVPPLTADETQWLAALNQEQEQYDGSLRVLTGLRRDLYEVWWKWQAAKVYARESGTNAWPWKTSDAQFATAVDHQTAAVRAQLALLQSALAAIPHAEGDVTFDQAVLAFTTARSLRAELVLKPMAQPRYWSATDPVAVVSSTAHLIKIDPGALLACRWPSQIATDITAGDFSIAASALAALLPAMTWTGLPSVAQSLYAEFFLLDPSSAGAASQVSSHMITAEMIAAATPASGSTMPALRQGWPWSQAWRPLFFDWQIEWYAIPFEGLDGRANWAFNGLEYDLIAPPKVAQSPASISGRTMLSAKPSFEFKSRLDQFLADHPDSDAAKQLRAVDDIVEQVDQWDFLSQSLGGLQTSLAKRNPVSSLNPDNLARTDGPGIADLIGGDIGPPPRPQLDRIERQPPVSTFEGLRAGQFYFNQVMIVDAFGQVLPVVRPPVSPDVIPRMGDDNQVFHPLLADGVTSVYQVDTTEPKRFVQLPPRLLQPARLNLRFSEGAQGSAIAGWLVPNHLGASLAVFAADGSALGSIAPGANSAPSLAQFWLSAPGSPYPDGANGFQQMVEGHGRLGQLLAGLSGRGTATFATMLQTIDETLWTIDPLGARSDAFLSVLVGRPLAVVAASISLELQTPAFRDPDWPFTFDQPAPAPAVLRYCFPVRLGDLGYHQDGLIGYFKDEDYARFNALHVPEGAADPYLASVGPGNYVDLGLADGGPGESCDLTFLVDPRGAIHAQCALVPAKTITLPPAWVDQAFAAMAIGFATGPLLVETRQVTDPKGSDVSALVLDPPAENYGKWSWVERDPTGAWRTEALTPSSEGPVLSDVRPTLREGVLKLSDALGSE